MQNYFNYFTEIEERFQQRRGALLLLSTLDWALIETWREAGIPLEAALRGIDAAFDKYEARQKRGRMRRINGLAWCAQAVMEAAEELREAAAGTRSGNIGAARIGFEQERVAAHLEAAAAALDAATVAPEACARNRGAAARTGRRGARARRGERGSSRSGSAGTHPHRARRETFCRVDRGGSGRVAGGLKEHAARELAPYRSRMGAVQLRQVERQFVQKQLLVHYNLPRLSLFYMSQQ